MSLRCRAPTRIDLAGGTLDIWPIYLLLPEAATVNVAISLSTEARLETSSGPWRVVRQPSGQTVEADSPDGLTTQPGAEIAGSLLSFFSPDRPLKLTTRSEAPPQSGLGASSSLGVAIAGTLSEHCRAGLSPAEIIELVKDTEAIVLRTLTGAQDHYPPVYGGASALWWERPHPRREALDVDAEAFEKRFILAYTHQPHRSGANNWEVIKRFLDGDGATRRAFEQIGHTASRMRDALAASDLDQASRLLGQEWESRRQLAPEVSSPELEALIAAAGEAGATAAKACGAGGGGCLVIAAAPGRRAHVRSAIEEAGGSILEYHLALSGMALSS